MRADSVGSYVVLRLRYVLRPDSDHAEVSHNFRLSYTNRLSHTQGVRRDGEESLDRLLPVFYDFYTGRFRDGLCDLLRASSRYDLLPCALKQISEANPISKALVFPGIPLDEYLTCNFQAWKTGEVMYFTLSFVYGAFFPSSTAHTLVSDSFSVKDTMALLSIVYSAKRRYGGLTRVGGVPRLFDKILQDATTYFLVLSTGHLVLLFFEIFPRVSNRPIGSCSTAHDKIT